MSTSVWPPLPAHELKKEEEETTTREISWLLDSLQETLVSLKAGLEECYALLAPIEPGSTLVLSSPRSECIKGHVTRIGTRVVKGTLHLRLKTLPIHPLTLSLSPTNPLVLPALTNLRTLLNQSLDCVDITRWTGDRHSASFISSQLRLLHSIILEALSLLTPPGPSDPTPPPNWCLGSANDDGHWKEAVPGNLSVDLSLRDSGLLLTVRVLEDAQAVPNLGSRFALAIGAQRRLEHDEMDDVFNYRGEEVRVKEKVGCVSSADPSLLVLGAKLGALERTIGSARVVLRVVTGVEEEEGEEDDV